MAGTTVRLLLLMMTIWQVSSLSCNNYIIQTSTTADPALRYFTARTLGVCQSECTRMGNCTAFMWNTTFGRLQCYHVYQLTFRTSPHPNNTLALRDCSPGAAPAPPVFFTTTSTPPPTPTSCPPVEGVVTGLVVLIACFSAVGGILVGMLLTIKCCPASRGWFSGSSSSAGCRACTPSRTACKSCSPSCSTSNMRGCHGGPPPYLTQPPPPPMVGPLPSYSSWSFQGGVSPNTYNDTYTPNSVLD